MWRARWLEPQRSLSVQTLCLCGTDSCRGRGGNQPCLSFSTSSLLTVFLSFVFSLCAASASASVGGSPRLDQRNRETTENCRKLKGTVKAEAARRATKLGQGSRDRDEHGEVSSERRRTRAGSDIRTNGGRWRECTDREFEQQWLRGNGTERQEETAEAKHQENESTKPHRSQDEERGGRRRGGRGSAAEENCEILEEARATREKVHSVGDCGCCG